MKGFRVYNTATNKYITGAVRWAISPSGDLYGLDNDDYIIGPGCIMEYNTGIPDKNGKSIYEGDIISITTFNEGEELRAEVCHGEFYDYKVNDLFLGYYIRFGGVCRSLLQQISGIFKTCKIIGNIHDNPELLEVTE